MMNLLNWVRKYWLQDTQKMKWIHDCKGIITPFCQHRLIDRLLPSDGRDEFGVREECCGVCGAAIETMKD